MAKLYLLAETEITAPQAGPVRIESARGSPDNPPTLLPRDQEQTTSAHAV